MNKPKVFRPKGYKLTPENIQVINDHKHIGVDFRIVGGVVHAVCSDGLVQIDFNFKLN